MASSFTIEGRLADVLQETVYPARVVVQNGKIAGIEPLPETAATGGLPFLLPGFVDSHIHIESSLLVPAEFARLAVVHGTVATVSDPHEIANVCGIAGVEFMLDNARTVPFKFCFGAPSCVPATIYETAGASLDPKSVETLLHRPDIGYLSEVMNFPGVLNRDPDMLEKIDAAHRLGKPVDGHAPGLRGEPAARYAAALAAPDGSSVGTDHECFTAEEALEKLRCGMKIIIREGSAAKNFDALIDLLHEWPDHILFCSDDKHPDSLLEGHINQHCARAVARGMDLFNVLRAACVNPVRHYRLPVGLLQPGDPADFIVVEDLVTFRVLRTFINGQLVAENGQSHIARTEPGQINRFDTHPLQPADLQVPWQGEDSISVIGALDGQLITNKLILAPRVQDGCLVSDPDRDLLKIVVVNRYKPSPPALAFIRNTGLKEGALASSVAHDSHNIVAVGVDDESLCHAINLVINARGGLSAVSRKRERLLELPIAGLMSPDDGYRVAEAYTALDRMAKEELGATLTSPFMTLSFMALLVIPHLKLSDKGLFDGDDFRLLS